MNLSKPRDGKIVVDNIHGDIHLSELEWAIIDTPTFQRLRLLKQLQMGHLTYPNATHTRFAHSLGVFAITCRVLQSIGDQHRLGDDDIRRIRLAALLHDVGHYPYSHLMESVDFVMLTEERFVATPSVNEGRTINTSAKAYPGHEEIGELVLRNQKDIRKLLGGEAEAKEIAALFRRTDEAHPQLSKLIHSSLDMDRLDYLIRDAQSTGTPYGKIDLDYILNNVRVSRNGVLGVSFKALPAAEHFLLARLFMHRTVYWHKTTYGFEEACRQLLRRIRQQKSKEYDLPADGEEVIELVTSSKLGSFSDAMIDRVIQQAQTDKDRPIRVLARSIAGRKAPKLLREITIFSTDCKRESRLFANECRHHLPNLARKHRIPMEQFLYCESKPLKIEERGSLLTPAEAANLTPEEKTELIKVFKPGEDEPISLVDIQTSPISLLARHRFQLLRLYVVCDTQAQENKVSALRKEIAQWDCE